VVWEDGGREAPSYPMVSSGVEAEAELQFSARIEAAQKGRLPFHRPGDYHPPGNISGEDHAHG